eukprot:TRINITY_DN17925_c0_g1_i2.p1 TRINITY_DN17925_c0_g1~~TRINITY_DN17925_c0_g1_i2.p1  ORF type:complete len:573 (-),score=95.70 TRINITY_DN17925_c0_g1_i2:18-1568(-)
MSDLLGRQAYEGDTDYSNDNVYTYGALGDSSEFAINDMIVCWANQGKFLDNIGRGWYAATIDNDACENSNAEPRFMNFWLRGTQPTWFAAFQPTILELVVYLDMDGGIFPIYLVAVVREEVSLTNPVGDYSIGYFAEFTLGEASASLQASAFTRESDDGFEALVLVFESSGTSGDQSYTQTSVSVLALEGGDADSGLMLTTSENTAAETNGGETCVYVDVTRWNADYIYAPQSVYTCNGGNDCEGCPDLSDCYDRGIFHEFCYDYKLYDSSNGDRIDLVTQVWGSDNSEDDTWASWNCENFNGTVCCDYWASDFTYDGSTPNPTMPLPVTFRSWTQDGSVTITAKAPAVASDRCTKEYSWAGDVFVEVELFNGDATSTTPYTLDDPIDLGFYNHTTANDRNGKTITPGSANGSFEYRAGGWNYLWFMPEGAYVKDGTVMGDSGQYIAMCPYLYQEFQPSNPSNCDGLDVVNEALWAVEAPEPVQIPDDLPAQPPVEPQVVGGMAVGGDHSGHADHA